MPEKRFSFILPAGREAEVARRLINIIPSTWVGDWGEIEQAIFSKPRRGGGPHTAHCQIATVPSRSAFKDEEVQPAKVKLYGRLKDLGVLLEFCQSECAQA